MADLNVMQNRDMKKVSAQQRVVKIIVKVLLYAFLITMGIIVLFPFYWMIISSLKTVDEYRRAIPTLIPEYFDIRNYVEVFTSKDLLLGRLFANTLYVGVVSTALSLVITVLSAFAFARLEFKGRNALFALLLATMMIPGELFTITNYQTVNTFGWMKTYTVLIVPFLVSIFYIYLLKQNFMQVPNELYLAAKVDGTSDIKYLWKVMIPICKPTIVTITILKVIECWNSYIWPRLITDDQAYFLVSNGIQEIRENGFGRENIPAMMAAVVVISVPLIVLFLIFRKKIMAGVSRGGVKG